MLSDVTDGLISKVILRDYWEVVHTLDMGGSHPDQDRVIHDLISFKMYKQSTSVIFHLVFSGPS